MASKRKQNTPKRKVTSQSTDYDVSQAPIVQLVFGANSNNPNSKNSKQPILYQRRKYIYPLFFILVGIVLVDLMLSQIGSNTNSLEQARMLENICLALMMGMAIVLGLLFSVLITSAKAVHSAPPAVKYIVVIIGFIIGVIPGFIFGMLLLMPVSDRACYLSGAKGC